MVKTRALVLSGGGALGAYQVGVLSELIKYRPEGWQRIAGVSVGALNGAMLAMHRPEDQHLGVKELQRVWEGITKNEHIYKSHASGYLTYLWSFWKRSLYTMEPLNKLIQKEFDETKALNAGVNFSVGVVGLKKAKYKSARLGVDRDFGRWIYASCLFPGLMQPAEFAGEIWVDGGVRNTVPLTDVLLDSKITHIDVIVTAPRSGSQVHKENFKSAVDVGLRAAQIMSDEVLVTDFFVTESVKAGKKISVWAPSTPLPRDGFEFNKESHTESFDRGVADIRARHAFGLEI
jgi:predicted acylesterase/phospholipase RssA